MHQVRNASPYGIFFRAQGKPRDVDLTVVSDLQGAFKVDKGDVTFSRLGFSVPGAEIDLAGHYSIDSGQLDFRGKLVSQVQQPAAREW